MNATMSTCGAAVNEDVFVSRVMPKVRREVAIAASKYPHFTAEEMAREFGCTANAVYGRVHKARKRFAAIYQKMVNDDFAQVAGTHCRMAA